MDVKGTSSAASAQSTYTPPVATQTNQATQEDKTQETVKKNENEKGYVNDVNYKPDTEKVNKMIKEAEAKMESFKKMVEKLILKQGYTAENIFEALRTGNFEVDEQTRLEAQQAISDEGYYGVEQTSQRIFDFAYAISGGDPEQVEKMRDAVKKGFESAEKIWGGKLPDISQKTYEATMKKFDEWAKSTKAATGAASE